MAEDISHSGDQDLKLTIKEKVVEQLGWLNELTRSLGGEKAKLEDIFPAPPEVRNDAPMPDWTPEQEADAREIGRRFGYGAEQDVLSGLAGVVSIAEGGKVWKIMAEAEAIKAEDSPRVIFSGSQYRRLGEDELNFLKENHDLELPPETTEYDAARWVAEQQIAGPSQPEVLPFGYEVGEGNKVFQAKTGQLIRLGTADDGRSIELFRVDRENYEDTDGSKKYRFQPDNLRVMGIVSEILSLQGDEASPVSLATSNTYASRQVNAIRAGLSRGRHFAVTMYGRRTITGLGAPVPAETPLNHLPGDLRVTHDSLQKLLSELQD